MYVSPLNYQLKQIHFLHLIFINKNINIHDSYVICRKLKSSSFSNFGKIFDKN
jgi:hypothetical protein